MKGFNRGQELKGKRGEASKARCGSPSKERKKVIKCRNQKTPGMRWTASTFTGRVMGNQLGTSEGHDTLGSPLGGVERTASGQAC